MKRIDIIIEAFKKMPEKKLVIVSTGSDEKRLKEFADGCVNIKFTGAVDEKTLLQLYATCEATIIAAKDEDLGLVPIESNASGKPCIAIREGGFKETIIEGKTGVFFDTPDAESIMKAVERCEKIKWNTKAIKRNAKRFDTKVFIKRMENIMKSINKHSEHDFNEK